MSQYNALVMTCGRMYVGLPLTLCNLRGVVSSLHKPREPNPGYKTHILRVGVVYLTWTDNFLLAFLVDY